MHILFILFTFYFNLLPGVILLSNVFLPSGSYLHLFGWSALL